METKGDNYMKRIGLLFISFFCLVTTIHAEDGVLKTSPLAVAFGSQPDFRSLHMSPDGTKLVVAQYHPKGYDFARTLDLKTMKSAMVYAATDQFDIDWCGWANDKRILCGLSAMTSYQGINFKVTRLIGVDWDGKNLILLQPEKLKNKNS